MRPLYEEFDGFDFDDSVAVKRLMREQRREAERLAKRRAGRRGHGSMHMLDAPDSDTDIDSFGDYEDCDENELDSYSDMSIDH